MIRNWVFFGYIIIGRKVKSSGTWKCVGMTLERAQKSLVTRISPNSSDLFVFNRSSKCFSVNAWVCCFFNPDFKLFKVNSWFQLLENKLSSLTHLSSDADLHKIIRVEICELFQGQSISEMKMPLVLDLQSEFSPCGCILSEFADSFFYLVKSPCRAI